MKHFLIKTNDSVTLHDVKLSLSNALFYNTIIEVSELKDEDFKCETVKDDAHPDVIGRRVLNLRTGSLPESNQFVRGSICKFKGISGPELVIEEIKTDGRVEVVYIGTNGFITNHNIHIDLLEVVDKSEKESTVSDITVCSRNSTYSLNNLASMSSMFRDSVINNQKISAIKELRALTDSGLKDAKDAVEAITPTMIRNWQLGVFK